MPKQARQPKRKQTRRRSTIREGSEEVQSIPLPMPSVVIRQGTPPRISTSIPSGVIRQEPLRISPTPISPTRIPTHIPSGIIWQEMPCISPTPISPTCIPTSIPLGVI